MKTKVLILFLVGNLLLIVGSFLKRTMHPDLSGFLIGLGYGPLLAVAFLILKEWWSKRKAIATAKENSH